MDISKFNIAEYLDSNEMIVAYLQKVLRKGEENDLKITLKYIAKTIGREDKK